uniref:Uncharacterized protein n=1 Tax=Anguilla anguilla TaxID=7936 RepID=A0A0E9WNA7_ANGAN
MCLHILNMSSSLFFGSSMPALNRLWFSHCLEAPQT